MRFLRKSQVSLITASVLLLVNLYVAPLLLASNYSGSGSVTAQQAYS